MAGVDFVRSELLARLEQYRKIDDACEGQDAIKRGGTIYLPTPQTEDTDPEDLRIRYGEYLQRAQYINFSGRTVESLSGLIFVKSPVFELPPLCTIIKKNADGSGVSLEQVSKNAVDHVIKKGRAGILVDYPKTDRAATIAELENGDIRPVIVVYNPEAIINWDFGVKGGKIYYTLIVIKERYSERKPGDFEVDVKDQYRVLELVDANNVRYGEKIGEGARYRQTVYRKSNATSKAAEVERVDTTEPNLGQLNQAGYVSDGGVFPRDGKGKELSELPFTFIGAKSNDASVDKPPMLDIVNVNIGHYVNSADYEDSCFMVGQPTPVASGITDQWWKNVLKGRLRLGSRSTIPLPPNATATLLQAQPNTMVKDAMVTKQEQMVSLGAKLIEDSKVSKTATEDINDNIAENSVLGNIASNVEAAIKFSLEWCAIFTGEITQDRDAKDDSIKVELNKKFNTHGSTAAERAQSLKDWMADAITFSEYRRIMRRAGLELDNDDEALKEIQREQQLQLEFETERNKALAEAAAPNIAAGGVKNKATAAKVEV